MYFVPPPLPQPHYSRLNVFIHAKFDLCIYKVGFKTLKYLNPFLLLLEISGALRLFS